MNTPAELVVDHNYVNETSNQYFDRLQQQFMQDYFRHKKLGRDYGKILHESNKPAPWYRPPPTTRSIYLYDPHYQRLLESNTKSSLHTPAVSPRNRPQTRSKSPPTKPNKNYNLKSSFNKYQHNQKLPSRLQPVPILPPIDINKKV